MIDDEQKLVRRIMRRVRDARDFPSNTCAASRHAQIIGEHLVKGRPYPMLQDEPEHCGLSILATVAALYEARAMLKWEDASDE